MTLSERRAWADRNEVAGYRLLGRHTPDAVPRPPRRFGGCVACPTGRRSGFFNPIVVVEPTAPTSLRAAVGWLRDQRSSLSLRIRDDLETEALRATAVDLGLERAEWVEAVMVMSPLHAAPPAPAGLSIRTADRGTIELFHLAATNAFGIGDGGTFMRDLVPPDMADDPDVGLFAGVLDGEPVASSIALRSGPIVGVYSVGTAAGARRRGIGTAMTWRAVEFGRARGCTAATLQATEMGEPVYRSMGFERVAGYVTWNEPARPPS